MAKLAIVYYSMTGRTYRVAQAVAEGAAAAGAEVRLRKVRDLAPTEVIASMEPWQAHVAATSSVPEVSLDDLEWADGYIFGTPTRYGSMAAPLKQFIDSTGPLWGQGKLANKVAAGFTGAQNPHGGQESTLLSLYQVFYHWGAAVVPPGYTDPAVFAAGGNPYGVSHTADRDGISAEVLAAARYMGGRVARYAAVLAENRGRL